MYLCTYLQEVCIAIHELPTYVKEFVFSLLQCYCVSYLCRKNLYSVYYSATVWATYVGSPCLQSYNMLLYELPTLEDLVCSLLQCYCMSYQCRKTLSAVYYSATVWATYVGSPCLQSYNMLLYELPTLEDLVGSLLQCYCMSYQCRKTLSAVYYSAMYELPMQEELVCSLLVPLVSLCSTCQREKV